jgi:hypothetical protein
MQQGKPGGSLKGRRLRGHEYRECLIFVPHTTLYVSPLQEQYLTHNSLSQVPVLGETNSVQITNSNSFTNVHFNISLPLTPRSPEWLYPPPFPSKILYAFLISPYVLHAATHLTLLNLTSVITLGVEKTHKLWISSVWNFCKPPVTSFH